MNRAKWQNVSSPGLLVVKLAEETGEVAKAYLDHYESDTHAERTKAHQDLMEELEHVEFIVGRIRELARLGT